MVRSLRVLIVEDYPDDASLMLLALREGGFDPTSVRVDSAESLRAAWAAEQWDIVLAGYSLPGFGAPAALRIVRETEPEIPFIVVSETVGENAAVAIMRAGANDYIPKHEIARLAPAVERELHEAENRRAKRVAERSIAHLATIVNTSDDAIISKTLDGVITSWNLAAEKLYGWTAAEAIARNITFMVPDDKITELTGIMARLRAGEQGEYFETVRIHRDGRRIDVSISISPIRDADGILGGVSKTARDITERKQVEKALRESENRLRAIIQTEPECVKVVSREGYLLEMNPAGLAMLQADSLEEARRKSLLDFIVPEHRAAFRDLHRRVINGENGTLVYEIVGLKGGRCWLETHATPLHNAAGKIQSLLGITRDITKRKVAEDALRLSEHRFRELADAIPQIVWIAGPDGSLTHLNAKANEYTGLAIENLTGWSWESVIYPEDLPRTIEVWTESLRTGTPRDCEFRIRRSDGQYRWHITRQVPGRDSAGAVIAWYGTCTDIEELKQSAEALGQSETRKTAILETALDGIVTMDHEGKVVEFNAAAERIFDHHRIDVIGKELSGLIIPLKHREPHSNGMAKFLATGEGPILNRRLELPALRADGTEFPVEIAITPILTNGLPLFTAFVRDLTERKESEQALQVSEHRLKHVLASSPAVLYTLTIEGTQILGINWISDNLRDLLGYSPEEAFSPHWWIENVDPKSQDRVIAKSHEQLFGLGHSTLEYRFRHRDGQYRWTRSELRLIRDASGRAVEAVGSWSDITELKQLEEQFRQVQKMEAVGQLAGGVAHDFNNLLTIINGYSEILLERLPPNDASRELIDEIHKAGVRSAGLTRQLLAFSRQQVLAPQLLNLNAVMASTEKMLHRLIGEDVRLTSKLDPELGTVLADPGQIEQVLMNLAVNARDAMPRGGRMTIETRNITLDETYVRTHPDATSGPYVLLSMTDTGCGIPREVMARIFEPFFTTKGPGKGTGLGLATVYGIIKQSGGHVAVYSELGVGTSFKVYLPQVAQAVLTSVPKKSGIMLSPRGTETILLAEDEDSVRALIRHVLTERGYKVLEAINGDEAVRYASRYDGPIHLLITDVVMPGSSGRAVAEELSERYHEMRVLFVSGYTDDAVIRHGVLREGVNFLQKPFSPDALAFKVREALDRPFR